MKRRNSFGVLARFILIDDIFLERGLEPQFFWSGHQSQASLEGIVEQRVIRLNLDVLNAELEPLVTCPLCLAPIGLCACQVRFGGILLQEAAHGFSRWNLDDFLARIKWSGWGGIYVVLARYECELEKSVSEHISQIIPYPGSISHTVIRVTVCKYGHCDTHDNDHEDDRDDGNNDLATRLTR